METTATAAAAECTTGLTKVPDQLTRLAQFMLHTLSEEEPLSSLYTWVSGRPPILPTSRRCAAKGAEGTPILPTSRRCGAKVSRAAPPSAAPGSECTTSLSSAPPPAASSSSSCLVVVSQPADGGLGRVVRVRQLSPEAWADAFALPASSRAHLAPMIPMLRRSRGLDYLAARYPRFATGVMAATSAGGRGGVTGGEQHSTNEIRCAGILERALRFITALESVAYPAHDCNAAGGWVARPAVRSLPLTVRACHYVSETSGYLVGAGQREVIAVRRVMEEWEEIVEDWKRREIQQPPWVPDASKGLKDWQALAAALPRCPPRPHPPPRAFAASVTCPLASLRRPGPSAFATVTPPARVLSTASLLSSPVAAPAAPANNEVVNSLLTLYSEARIKVGHSKQPSSDTALWQAVFGVPSARHLPSPRQQAIGSPPSAAKGGAGTPSAAKGSPPPQQQATKSIPPQAPAKGIPKQPPAKRSEGVWQLSEGEDWTTSDSESDDSTGSWRPGRKGKKSKANKRGRGKKGKVTKRVKASKGDSLRCPAAPASPAAPPNTPSGLPPLTKRRRVTGGGTSRSGPTTSATHRLAGVEMGVAGEVVGQSDSDSDSDSCPVMAALEAQRIRLMVRSPRRKPGPPPSHTMIPPRPLNAEDLTWLLGGDTRGRGAVNSEGTTKPVITGSQLRCPAGSHLHCPIDLTMDSDEE